MCRSAPTPPVQFRRYGEAASELAVTAYLEAAFENYQLTSWSYVGVLLVVSGQSLTARIRET